MVKGSKIGRERISGANYNKKHSNASMKTIMLMFVNHRSLTGHEKDMATMCSYSRKVKATSAPPP